MRGGRGGRGRGGRGRGEEVRSAPMVTRSSVELPDIRAESSDSEEDDPKTPETANLGGAADSELKDHVIEEELRVFKAQLEGIQKKWSSMAEQKRDTPIAETELAGQPTEHNLTDFPALGCSKEKNSQPLLSSWKEKVSAPNPPTSMPLKFIPPVIENGIQVVHIDSQDVVDLVNVWEKAIVLYVVGGNVNVDIIRGFIRKFWSFASMPIIHTHEEGYYILRFNAVTEVNDILKGGPYFLNRAPLIVKQWSMNFDFKEEILRVIPVWVRLPNLPLYCWGEETLSRIVSAVGVPILADECTSKQWKISFARVLVEIDITKEFVKEVRVRDNTGREFNQMIIPEWRPYFCPKCNKIGHECKPTKEASQSQQPPLGNDESNIHKDKSMWIPVSIARMVKGLRNVDDVRKKITGEQSNCFDTATDVAFSAEQNDSRGEAKGQNAEQEADDSHENQLSNVQEGSVLVSNAGGTDLSAREEVNEANWSVVPHGKTARRAFDTSSNNSPHVIVYSNSVDKAGNSTNQTMQNSSVITELIETCDRDGTPTSPSIK